MEERRMHQSAAFRHGVSLGKPANSFILAEPSLVTAFVRLLVTTPPSVKRFHRPF